MAVGNKFAESQGLSYVPNDMYLQEDFKGSTPLDFSNISSSGIMSQTPIPRPLQYIPPNDGSGRDDDDDDDKTYDGPSISPIDAAKQAGLFFLNPTYYLASKAFKAYQNRNVNKKNFAKSLNKREEAYNKSGNLDDLSDTPSYSIPDTNDPGGGGGGYSQERNDAGVQSAEDDMKDGGRAGYFFGGRVNYKAGGRTGYKDGYSVQDDMGDYAANVGKEAAPGGGFVGDGGNDGGNTKPTFYNKNDNIITTDFISKNPNLTINYADPKNYASVFGKIGFKDLIDNDNIEANANVMGGFGPVNYDASFTEKGLTGIDLTAGKFNANLNPDMQVQNIGYNNNINGINYGVNTDFDNTMFTAGVNFKNGGLASIL